MPTSARAPKRARLRLRSALSAAAATALAVTGLASVVAAAPAAAAPGAAPLALVETCPPDGGMPPIGNVPNFTDSGIAVFVGGDYLADANAAESEGLLVVAGDATFARAGGGGFDVGTAGVGSGIVPAEGEPMLQVGGALTVSDGNTLRVGLLVGGGAVKAGEAVTGTIDNGGKPVEQDLGAAAALAPHAGFGDVVRTFSTTWGGVAANGTTLAAGNSVAFSGHAPSGHQVFEIAADDLDGASEFHFDGIPAGAPIVVNVVGGPVELGMNYASINGVRIDDLNSAEFGNSASRILWNFVGAPAVDITGTGQFMGSIVAPDADVTVTASTNGRVYVGGDFNTRGSGNEQHNYPWIGGGPLECVPTDSVDLGGFDAAKTIVGSGAALVPDATEFTISWEASLDGEPIESGTLALLADGTVTTGPTELPVGAIVTITEIDLPEVANVEWGEPQISPDVFTVEKQLTVAVEVTNEAISTVQPPVGGFSAKKVVDGPAAGLVPDEAQFALAYEYSLAGEPITGELLVTADGTVVNGPQGLPVGTVVEFAELAPPAVPGVEWGAVSISPATVTIAADENIEVTVTNTAGTPSVVVGGFSAAKAVTGAAASLVPADTVFTLAYEYALGDETVTGTLALPADGTVVAGPQDLPVGTVVSFEEIELPSIPGVVWGEPVLSADEIAVAAGADTRLTVTNTANAAPVTPTTPSATPAAGGQIAHTGVDGLVPAIAAAALLLAAGVALVVARRRRA